MSLLKVCLIGAESTGKSTLAHALAHAFRTRGYWAQATDEALRLFCERFGRLPTAADEPIIFEAQQRAERVTEQLIAKQSDLPGFLICDSSPLLTAFTSLWYFADESLLAAGMAHQQSYLRCYLTEPSLPWEADGIQRDGPAVRAKFHSDLSDFLQTKQVPHETIALRHDAVSKGSEQATALVDQLLAMAGLPRRR